MKIISKIIAVTSALIILFGSNAYSQNDTIMPAPKDKVPFKDRLVYGGNLGLQFGTVTYIDISPTIGYKITEKFHAGIGATYIYYSEKYPLTNGQTYTYKTDIYGGKVFTRYYVLENLFLHHETEVLNLEVYDPLNDKVERKNILSPLLGAGYIQRFGESSGLYLMVLFNLNETPDSPYTNPIIRMGLSFGL
ncbi:MAG TPA: hypothetical protein PKN75_13850 [Bacteroidia bacterium]|nr:hypothetical protein [Bacteroidia bacterium]HNU34666.1 hypothetical protein [Bacteroidia bacterium]